MDLWEINVSLFRLINNQAVEGMFFNPVAVLIAEYTTYLLGLFVIALFFTKHKIVVGSAVVSVIISVVAGKMVGLLHSNNPPFAVLSDVNQLIEKSVGNSFPSDHTMIIAAICFTFFLFRVKLRGLWIVLPIAVAVSRVMVGVHYPFDVLVSLVISGVVSYVVYRLRSKLF